MDAAPASGDSVEGSNGNDSFNETSSDDGDGRHRLFAGGATARPSDHAEGEGHSGAEREAREKKRHGEAAADNKREPVVEDGQCPRLFESLLSVRATGHTHTASVVR